MFRAKAVYILLMLLLSSKIYAVRFPSSSFFPFTPGFSFSLVSDRENAIDVTTRIDLPSADNNPDVFFLTWYLKMNIENQKVQYILRFTVETNGDTYINEMRDDVYQRFFEPGLLVFPDKIQYNNPISLGENIELNYIKSLSGLRVNDKNFKDVIVAELSFSSHIFTLYFAKNSGIVGIKSENETFKVK